MEKIEKFILNNSVIYVNWKSEKIIKKINHNNLSVLHLFSRFYSIPEIKFINNEQKIVELDIIKSPVLSRYVNNNEIPKLFLGSIEKCFLTTHKLSRFSNENYLYEKRFFRLKEFSYEKKGKIIHKKILTNIKNSVFEILDKYNKLIWLSNGDFHLNNFIYPNYILDFDLSSEQNPFFYDFVTFFAFEFLEKKLNLKNKNLLIMQDKIFQTSSLRQEIYFHNMKKIFFWFKDKILDFNFLDFKLAFYYRVLTMKNLKNSNLLKLLDIYKSKNIEIFLRKLSKGWK